MGESHTDSGKVASHPSILDIFPQDLIQSRSKIEPIKIRKVEHDTYIDYEIEFLEIEHSYHPVETAGDLEVQDTSDDRQLLEEAGTLEDEEVNLETFVELLRQARIRYQTKMSMERRRRRRVKLREGNRNRARGQNRNLVLAERGKIQPSPHPRTLRRQNGGGRSQELHRDGAR